MIEQTQRLAGIGFVLLLGVAMAAGCGDNARGDVVGSLHGTVSLEGSEGAAGVIVKADEQSTTTEADGAYQLAGLPPGSVRVEASLEGYETVEKDVPVVAGESAKADFELALLNHAPEIESLSVQPEELVPGGEGTATVEVTDLDEDDELTYAWTGTEGFSAEATETPGEARILAPDEARAQGLVKVTITDEAGAEATAEVPVKTVDSSPPRIAQVTATPPVVKPHSTSKLKVYVEHEDDDETLTYKWEAPPEGFELAETEGQEVTLRAPDKRGEAGAVKVTVTDSAGLSDSSYVTVQVEQNQPPVIETVFANPPEVHPAGEMQVEVKATDPDGADKDLIYEWNAPKGWLMKTPSKPTTKVSAPNEYGATGFLEIVVRDDGTSHPSDNDSSHVTRQRVAVSTVKNVGPRIASFTASPSMVTRGGKSSLQIEATDPEDKPLTYQWNAPQGWSLKLDPNVSSRALVTAPDKPDQSGRFEVKVKDIGSATTTAAVVVKTAPNRLPKITSLTAKPPETGPGGKIELEVIAEDKDPDTLSYSWSASSGWSITGNGATATATAPTNFGETGVVKVTVDDGQGGSVTGQIVVKTGRNSPPAIDELVARPNPTTAGGTMELVGTASDPDGNTLNYKWSVQGSNWTLTPNGTKAKLQAPNTPNASTVVTWTVSDSAGGTVSKQVPVSTATNAAPRITSNPPTGEPVAGRQQWVYDVEARDPNGDTLTYKLSGKVPQGVKIDAKTGKITWTPTRRQVGAYKLTIEVSDGVNTSVQTVTGDVQAYDLRNRGRVGGGYSDGFIVADFDQDGRDDVATLEGAKGRIKVALATKDGFGAQTAYTSTSKVQDCRSFAAGDIDRDGDPDLVAACYRYEKHRHPYNHRHRVQDCKYYCHYHHWHTRHRHCGQHCTTRYKDHTHYNEEEHYWPGFRVWENQGDGTFKAGNAGYHKSYDNNQAMAAAEVADINGDGFPDFVQISHDGRMVTWLNNKKKNFSRRQYKHLQASVRDIAAGNVDTDPLSELVIAAYKSGGKGRVQVVNFDSNGNIKSTPSENVGTCPWDVELRDLDGNQKLDVAMADRCTGAAHIGMNKGNGSFTFDSGTKVSASNCLSGFYYGETMDVADLDGDGHFDWLFSQSCRNNGEMVLAFGDKNAKIGEVQKLKAENLGQFAIDSVAFGDWNKDKRFDVYGWTRGSDNPFQVLY